MILRKFLAVGAILAPLAMFAAPASATDVATVVGTGTISPGLPLTGCANQHVTFSSTATVNAGDHTGTYNFSFDGNSSICETLENGEGSGNLSGDVTGAVSYSRTGGHVSVSGSVTLSGDTENIIAAECAFHPVPGNPITNYALNCHVVLG